MADKLYANPRAWRVRVAQAAIWLSGLIILWLCWFLPPHPADTVADRVVVALAPWLVIAAIVSIELYVRHYVLRLEDEGAALAVTTLATLRRRTLHIEKHRLRLGASRHDYAAPGLAPGVNNSYVWLHIEGWRWPLIVDETPPAALDRMALTRVLERL